MQRNSKGPLPCLHLVDYKIPWVHELIHIQVLWRSVEVVISRGLLDHSEVAIDGENYQIWMPLALRLAAEQPARLQSLPNHPCRLLHEQKEEHFYRTHRRHRQTRPT